MNRSLDSQALDRKSPLQKAALFNCQKQSIIAINNHNRVHIGIRN